MDDLGPIGCSVSVEAMLLVARLDEMGVFSLPEHIKLIDVARVVDERLDLWGL